MQSLMGALLDARRDRRATVEPAGTLERPNEPILAAMGYAPSASGVSVTEASSQGIPVVFACDKVIKQDVAKTPIKLKRLLPDGTRQDDRNHPVYSVLHDQPNPATTPYEFKESMQHSVNLWGNGYAEITRDPRNQVKALWPLEPHRMTVELNAKNQLQYTYRMAYGKPKEWIFDPANPPILHLRQNVKPGHYVGRAPVALLREQMGVVVSQDRYQGSFYGQGGHPRVALSTSQKLTEGAARRIRTDFETLTVGQHNWHRVVVLDHDLKPVPLVMPHKDAQFLDLVRLGDERLCGVFRVPPHKVANLLRSTNNNIEHQAIEYVGDCLMPHFVCWQQAIARDLLNPKSFGTHTAVFIVDALVRGDSASLNASLQTQRQNGVITANQWRRILDMDDQISEADGGDVYMVNSAMVPMRRDPAAAIDFDVPPNGGVN